MKFQFVFIVFTFLLISCNSEEKESFESTVRKYNSIMSFTGDDYDTKLDLLNEADNAIKSHISEYSNTKNDILLLSYAEKIASQKKDLLKEQAAYERITSKRRNIASSADIIQETQDIKRFMETFPGTIKSEELENRLVTLSSMMDDVFIEELNKELNVLWGKMDAAAANKASEIHPLSNTNSFTVTSNEKPQMSGPGNYPCKRVYQISMSGIAWGHFNVVIAVEGIIKGDVNSGVYSEVKSVSVLQRE